MCQVHFPRFWGRLLCHLVLLVQPLFPTRCWLANLLRQTGFPTFKERRRLGLQICLKILFSISPSPLVSNWFSNILNHFSIATHWATQWLVNVHLWTVPSDVLKLDIPPRHFCSRFTVCSIHWSEASLLKEFFVLRTEKLPFLKVNIIYLKIRNFDIKKLMILSAKSDINWRNQFWWNQNSNKHSEINSISTIKF